MSKEKDTLPICGTEVKVDAGVAVGGELAVSASEQPSPVDRTAGSAAFFDAEQELCRDISELIP